MVLSKTLVTPFNLDSVVDELSHATELGFDTETYGLSWGKCMFSMQFATDKGSYYFNFHDYNDETPILNMVRVMHKLRHVFDNDKTIWYIHNAKFDMHRTDWAGRKIQGRIRDTVVWARLVYNQHFNYSLDSCLKRLGKEKNPAVEKYIAEHKCYTMVDIEGKGTKVKDKHYDQVPFDIMFEYGCDDAQDVLFLGRTLHTQVASLYGSNLIRREEDLTKVCAEMESRGAKVDLQYVRQGWKYEEEKSKELRNELTDLAGRPYKNGPKWLAETFDQFHIPYERHVKTGNPIFDKKALAKIRNPIADKVKDLRRSEKYISTYYSGFNHGAGEDSVIHANIRTGGTDTMRFSYSNPNLQNVPKEDSDDFEIYVRKCITPRENFNLVAIDFRQQEFRLMLDYANETRLIKAVNEGADLHQATADLVSCSRKHAKMVNFGLLYGMGVEALAAALGISVSEARDLKYRYFANLPKVEYFINNVIARAKTKKMLKTWTGRILRFPHRDGCYKGPNHLIQGGCSDMVREAMVRLAPKFEATKSGMLIQVHDEVVFEIHKNEMDIVPSLVDVMKNTYTPFNGMLMDCSVEVSDKSWGYCDMEEAEYGA